MTTEILEVEPRWYERGVKEAIHIRILNPSLNKDGGRHNLSPIWTNLLRSRRRGKPSSKFEFPAPDFRSWRHDQSCDQGLVRVWKLMKTFSEIYPAYLSSGLFHYWQVMLNQIIFLIIFIKAWMDMCSNIFMTTNSHLNRKTCLLSLLHISVL